MSANWVLRCGLVLSLVVLCAGAMGLSRFG